MTAVHGKQDLQRLSERAGVLDALGYIHLFPWSKPGNHFWKLDLIAMAFLSQDISVYPGAGPQPTAPQMSAQICLLAIEGCLATLGFH